MNHFYTKTCSIYIRSFALCAIFLFSFSPSQAKHLVGGSLTYKFLSSQNGTSRFLVTLTMYRDCNQTDFDPFTTISAYEDIGSKDFFSSFTLDLVRRAKVKPPIANSNCPFDPSATICLEEGVYEQTISLPNSSYGFHLLFARCCRNDLVNLQPNTTEVGSKDGQTYYNFIPSISTQNSTPVFTEIPAPYNCAKDTFYYSFNAKDPDGDSLAYELAWPWTGGTPSNPLPQAPANYTTPALVSYNSGFSFNKPYGNNGYASIDKYTGIIKAYAPSQGNYALAANVKEYRNGVLINTTRIDLQTIILACPENPAPVQISVDSTNTNIFTIYAGQRLTFKTGFIDKDKDNNLKDLNKIDLIGEVFNTNPAATHQIIKQGNTYKLTFDWQTTCELGRSNPYIFFAKAYDNGCPAKLSTFSFVVNVIPFIPASNIDGPTTVCTERLERYSAKSTPGSTLFWNIENGTILSGQGTPEVTVEWNDPHRSGTIKFFEISKYGCRGDTIFKNVTLNPSPASSPIFGPTGVCLDSIYTYYVSTNNNTSKRWWQVLGGKILSTGSDSNSIRVKWTKDSLGTIRFLASNEYDCNTDTLRLIVDVSRPKITKIYGSQSVCPNSRNIDYWVDKQSLSTYIWSVSGGVISGGQSTAHVTITWGEKGPGVVKVVEKTRFGCLSDTLTLPVLKDYTLFTPPIEGEDTVCEYTKGVEYSVIYSNGSVYQWNISGGTIVSGNGTSTILVDWDSAGTGILSLQETAYDSINQKQCIGQIVMKFIDLRPLPNTSPLMGDLSACEDLWSEYHVRGYEGSIFIWSGDTGVEIRGNGNDTVQIFYADTGIHTLVITEITVDSCIGESIIGYPHIHPTPPTSDISGPSKVCFPADRISHYSVEGEDNSFYDWKITGGFISSAETDKKEIEITWVEPGLHSIQVQETTIFGCIGSVKTLDVKVDGLTMSTRLVTTLYENDDHIRLEWDYQNDDFLEGYIHIYRTQDDQEFFALRDSVPASQNFYIDTRVNTSGHTYRYYAQASNICDRPVRSSPHRTVLLQGKETGDTTLQISWNAYEGWESDVERYEIYRRVNEDAFNDDNPYAWVKQPEPIDLVAELDGYRQCYRIAAINSQSKELVSWSNEFCFEFPPIVYVPNVFTPGSYDDINNTFQVFAANYKTFDLVIFNRWGERVFSSTEPVNQWNGTFKGKDSPDGVYLYTLKVTGLKKNVYKSGTINLLRN